MLKVVLGPNVDNHCRFNWLVAPTWPTYAMYCLLFRNFESPASLCSPQKRRKTTIQWWIFSVWLLFFFLFCGLHPYTEESPLYGCCCFSSFLWATQWGGRFEISKGKTIHSVRGSHRCYILANSKWILMRFGTNQGLPDLLWHTKSYLDQKRNNRDMGLVPFHREEGVLQMGFQKWTFLWLEATVFDLGS